MQPRNAVKSRGQKTKLSMSTSNTNITDTTDTTDTTDITNAANATNKANFYENISHVDVSASAPSLDEVKDPAINHHIEKHKYAPFVIKIPPTSADNNIFDTEINPVMTSNIDYPLFSLGFHHYIHSNKKKMEILNEFQGKKKVYLVMNEFERYIDNYPEDIGNTSDQYFKITKNKLPNILSRGFYKLWEMLNMFDLIDTSNPNFVSAHLAEGPGSFIQATMFFRERYTKSSKNDKYYAVTLHPEDEGGHVPDLETTFIKHYSTEKPQRFILHKTYSRAQSGGFPDRDNGDITDPKTIELFGGQMGTDKAHFITADGGINWENETTQEQESFRLIIGQIVAALKIQAPGGNFVCKFFEI